VWVSGRLEKRVKKGKGKQGKGKALKCKLESWPFLVHISYMKTAPGM